MSPVARFRTDLALRIAAWAAVLATWAVSVFLPFTWRWRGTSPDSIRTSAFGIVDQCIRLSYGSHMVTSVGDGMVRLGVWSSCDGGFEWVSREFATPTRDGSPKWFPLPAILSSPATIDVPIWTGAALILWLEWRAWARRRHRYLGQWQMRASATWRWSTIVLCFVIAAIWISMLWWSAGGEYGHGEYAVAGGMLSYRHLAHGSGASATIGFRDPEPLEWPFPELRGYLYIPGDLNTIGWRILAPFWTIELSCVVVAIMAWWRHTPYLKPGHCHVCDYDMRGNVSGRCPECGTPYKAPATPQVTT